MASIAGRAFPRRRVGAAPRDEHAAQPSAAMELGEAVKSAIERELPLLLSSRGCRVSGLALRAKRCAVCAYWPDRGVRRSSPPSYAEAGT